MITDQQMTDLIKAVASLREPEVDSTLRLALHDAANNCASDGAVATITLKGGARFEGALKKPSPRTGHLLTDGGGWVTFLLGEVAAVRAEPRSLR